MRPLPAVTAPLTVYFVTAFAAAADFPRFKVQEIDTGLKIGYAVLTADIDGDKKPDIVVVDQHKLVWYQNPGKPGADWKKRVMLDGKTKPDNVCAAALDLDGDGLPEIVLGSAWKPFDTANAGQLGWVRRGKTLDAEWTYHELPCDEPSVHRVRVFDIDGDGKPEIVHVPLMGRGATAQGSWLDGRPVRVVALRVPAKEPEKKENWTVEVLSEELHVCHNFWPVYPAPVPGRPRIPVILVTAYEGVFALTRGPDGSNEWKALKVGDGNQANPGGSRGASEVKQGQVGEGRPVIATIEPWHGNQVVTYTPAGKAGEWDRQVIDEQLRWGHAVWFADLDGDGADELIVGVRDDPNPKAGDKHTLRRGVRVYRCTDGRGAEWERLLLDEGGVAVEDLCAADLDGDGRIDIVAVGRATGNARIYWNQGK